MSGVLVELAAQERVLINGALLENGPQPGRIHLLSPEVHFVRLRDVIEPEQARSPLEHLCVKLQIVLSGARPLTDLRPQLIADLLALHPHLRGRSAESGADLQAAIRALQQDDAQACHRILCRLRRLEQHTCA
jgi:flagellar protein FlbT